MAKDVSLTLQKQKGTSILNILAMNIVGIKTFNNSSALIKLNSGDITLLCQITRQSLDNLKLKKVMDVFAQIKSMALLS